MNYIHHIPGRMRIRCAALKGNAAAAAAAKAMLATQPGVESVEANTVTGSMLIRYTGRADADRFVALLREHGYSRACHPVGTTALRRGNSPAQDPHTAGIGFVVARTLVSFAVEKAVERSVLALVTAIL
jgi:hypothetical protein